MEGTLPTSDDGSVTGASKSGSYWRCGLSDHDPAEITMDSFVHDLETVVDAMELERFALVGVSQGGAVAISYAARHPERVSHLVLVGAYVAGRRRRARSDDERHMAELQTEMIRLGWGSEDPSMRLAFAPSLIPDASSELWNHFATLMRRTTSATSAARVMAATGDVDVSDPAPQVARVPRSSSTPATSSGFPTSRPSD